MCRRLSPALLGTCAAALLIASGCRTSVRTGPRGTPVTTVRGTRGGRATVGKGSRGGRAVIVHEAPPPPRHVKIRPKRPGPAFGWAPGHWEWDGKWRWRKGHWWLRPRKGAGWTPARWERTSGGWRFVPGRWN